MDRGEDTTDRGIDAAQESVAADASTRVREILSEAETYAAEVRSEAERAVQEARRTAYEEADRLREEARESARNAARERGDHLAAIQAAMAARGPAVLGGLEGAGATRARLEELRAALAAAADRLLTEAESGDPAGAASAATASDTGAPASADDPASLDGPASPDDRASPDDPSSPEEPAGSPDRTAERAAPPSGDAPSPDAQTAAGEGDGSAAEPASPASAASRASAASSAHDGDWGGGDDGGFDGELPPGAPLARKPLRSRDRDARFSALLMALQGRDRRDVEAHLRDKYDVDDCTPILDEVFGRADAHA